jgi:4-hydroxy-3-methylbut-2-enyl diphosphate reductase IspH
MSKSKVLVVLLCLIGARWLFLEYDRLNAISTIVRLGSRVDALRVETESIFRTEASVLSTICPATANDQQAYRKCTKLIEAATAMADEN